MQNDLYKRLARAEAMANAQKSERIETLQRAYESACSAQDTATTIAKTIAQTTAQGVAQSTTKTVAQSTAQAVAKTTTQATVQQLLSAKNTGDTPNKWAEEATEWAKATGLIAGYADKDGKPTGDFAWQKPMTRQEMVALLYRFSKLVEK